MKFGEKILYMRATPARGGKWEPRFILVFLLAAEPVVGSSSCHRAKAGDQDSCREHLTKSRVGEIGCGMRAVPWSPDGSDNAFDVPSRHGEARGGGAPLFWRSAD